MSESESKPLPPGVITKQQAAALLKCTPQWVGQLEKQGYFTKVARDQYRLVEVVHGFIDYKASEERRTSKVAADSRVRDARAREYELKNAERERRLIDWAEHEAVVDELVGMVRSEFAGIAARVTRDLQLRRTIEQAINDVLTRLADAAAEKAEELGPDRAAPPSIETPDA